MSVPNRDELVHQAAQRGKDRLSRRILLVLGIATTLAIIATVIGGYLLWQEKQRQAEAGMSLAVQVQRACEDETTAVHLGSICTKAERVEATITAGPQGPPGDRGPAGVDGVDGRDGINGRDGAPGKNGRNGLNGQDGKDGAQGPAGPQGPEGPQGPPGKDGADGQDGAPAFPMQWTFEFSPNPAQSYQFLCVLLDPSQQVNCTRQ